MTTRTTDFSRSAALLLADGRFPAGGHAHSGGVEAAVAAGLVDDLSTLERFLRGRLRTAGLVAAALARVACARALESRDDWVVLDAEADARTPSPAQREASRRQGRALLRAARVAWPASRALASLASSSSSSPGEGAAPSDERPASPGKGAASPHHPVVLGAAAAAAGCSPDEAALVAAYQSVTGPASAAVRLLSLDPLAVNALLARLTAEADLVARQAATPGSGSGELPFPSAPALDLLAEAHVRAEVRLFAS
jgi:urease accessory protein